MLLSTDGMLRPIIQNYSENQAQIMAANLINQSVYAVMERNGIKYSDIVKLSKQEDGKVTSIETDVVKVNLIKAEVIGEIQKAVQAQNTTAISIPVGTLTGNDYMIGRGPNITIKLNMSTSILSDIDSKFEEAGINQTLHQIILHITAKVYMVMPWYRSSTEVKTDFSIAQTVIVGQVPEAFTNVIESDGKTAGNIFDYGADTPKTTGN